LLFNALLQIGSSHPSLVLFTWSAQESRLQEMHIRELNYSANMQDMDDVSVLSAMSRSMMPGAREAGVGKSRGAAKRRNGAAGAKRSTKR
jgi:hypothetical protein